MSGVLTFGGFPRLIVRPIGCRSFSRTSGSAQKKSARGNSDWSGGWEETSQRSPRGWGPREVYVDGKHNVRRFFQNLDEEYLSHTLKNIEEKVERAGRGENFDDTTGDFWEDTRRRATRQEAAKTSPFPLKIDHSLFSPSPITIPPPSNPALHPRKTAVSTNQHRADYDFTESTPDNPLSGYESRRGAPTYQDLTHSEARRIQEVNMRRLLTDRKIRWMKMNMLRPNLEIQAKKNIREREALAEEPKGGERLYPPPFMDEDPLPPRLYKQVNDHKYLLELRELRSRIRAEKIENSRLMNETAPTIRGIPADKILFHIQRRMERVSKLVHGILEQLLVFNSPKILYSLLGGVNISIRNVTMESVGGQAQVFYIINSEHDVEYVDKKLKDATPKLRFQLGHKLQLARVPSLKFIRANQGKELFSRTRLAAMRKEVLEKGSSTLVDSWSRERNGFDM